MRKKILFVGLLLTQLSNSLSIFAQDTLFLASNPNNVYDLQGYMVEFVTRTPQCKKLNVTEIGVNTHSTSAAGSLKLGLYKAGALIYQSDAITVDAGAGYYSATIPDGIGYFTENVDLGVVVLPSSADILFEKITNFTSDVSGELAANNTAILISANTYPTVPDVFTQITAWYGLLGMTIKGAYVPLDIDVVENSGVANDGTICEGSSVTLYPQSPSYLNFAWSNEINTFSNSVTPLTSSTYTVTVSFGSCQNIASKTITVLPLPNTSTSVSDFTITATTNNATYQWINCATNQTIAGATNQTFTATANGDYAVIVTQNGCSDTSACVTIDNVGLESLALSNISVYPNPSTTEVNISSADETIENIEIYNTIGKLISKESVNSNSKEINLTNYSTGVYVFKIQTNSGFVTKRVVVKS